MHQSVTEESIEKANALFWEQMLAMQLAPIEGIGALVPVLRCIGAGHVAASCSLSGVWSGRIEVRLSRGLALTATAAMLMQPEDRVEDADMLDAAKEIANMIAGTLKPDAGEIRLGASLKMGYFAQQSLDVLDPDLTVIEQLQKDFPHDGLGALRTLAGAFQFLGEDLA